MSEEGSGATTIDISQMVDDLNELWEYLETIRTQTPPPADVLEIQTAQKAVDASKLSLEVLCEILGKLPYFSQDNPLCCDFTVPG